VARRKRIDEVEVPEVIADPVGQEIVNEVSLPKEDAVLLKVNCDYEGTIFKKGTPVKELNPSESTLDFMKARNII